ncbi:MAG: AAA family ATPase, partial [Smithella sp.]
MIENLKIEHFKSIESLNIPCNRTNIFIGAPNTGKSNILEALSLFTFCEERLSGSGQPLSSYVRFKDLSNLFTDGVLDHEVHLEIRYNSKLEKISIQSKQNGYTLDDKTKVLGNNTEKTPLR